MGRPTFRARHGVPLGPTGGSSPGHRIHGHNRNQAPTTTPRLLSKGKGNRGNSSRVAPDKEAASRIQGSSSRLWEEVNSAQRERHYIQRRPHNERPVGRGL